MLYYRADLLEEHVARFLQPWAELTETAQFIQDAERAQGNPDIWGFVWARSGLRGATCDALEWVYSHVAGRSSTPTER